LQEPSEKKNSGNFSVLYPTTGTPSVSRSSRVLGTSKIALQPALTTATGVILNSAKSADISKVSSAPIHLLFNIKAAPRCTPPIPPVIKTLIPAK
jgi:hypothetical protein